MNRFSIILFLLSNLLAINLLAQQSRTNLPKNTTSPKNIILIIGNGMGLSHITAGMITNSGKSSLEKFPVTGIHKIEAYDNLISDAAAGATAFSSGVKTINGSIGTDHNNKPVTTIIEEAESRGLKTGVISSSAIIHPTPASFVTHNEKNESQEEIAEEFMLADIDYFVGGGRKYFARRLDGKNLIQNLISQGYQINSYLDRALDAVTITKDKFGYFTADEIPQLTAQNINLLPKATMKGIEYLSHNNNQGFFLMVAGSSIEKASRDNNQKFFTREYLELEKTITKVIQWAEKDRNTLVIVTADHETGGLTVNDRSSLDSLSTLFTTKSNTATMIPVFAYGPGAKLFSGIYQNVDIYHKMISALKWKLE